MAEDDNLAEKLNSMDIPDLEVAIFSVSERIAQDRALLRIIRAEIKRKQRYEYSVKEEKK